MKLRHHGFREPTCDRLLEAGEIAGGCRPCKLATPAVHRVKRAEQYEPVEGHDRASAPLRDGVDSGDPAGARRQRIANRLLHRLLKGEFGVEAEHLLECLRAAFRACREDLQQRRHLDDGRHAYCGRYA